MAKRYIRLNWQNAPNTATPLNAENLNIMDKGIDDIDTALENHINSMIHTDTLNDATKYPSAAVTYEHGTQISSLQNSVNELNNNLANNKVRYGLTNLAFVGGIATLTHNFGFTDNTTYAITANNQSNPFSQCNVVIVDGNTCTIHAVYATEAVVDGNYWIYYIAIGN